MNCPSCGKEIANDSTSCAHCKSAFAVSDGSDNADAADQTSAAQDIAAQPAAPVEPSMYCGNGRYKILRTIGQGGMGAIYEAHDVKLNIPVALKRLLPTMAAEAEGVERFLREAQAIAALNHFNIIRIFDINEDEQGHYISMELVKGENLRQRIKRTGPLDVANTVKFARQIAQGLGYAHKRDIIHRDIKPANILLGEEDVPKIVDFGLAAVSAADELADAGCSMGTLKYMPPEQKADAKSVDCRADIYALGGTMYEMITGRSPSVVRESDLPSALREIVLKCMEPDRECRFQNCEELIAALDAAVSQPSGPGAEPAAPRCPNCGRDNAIDLKFCQYCGANLVEKCPECEHLNRIGVRYCGRCGADLEQYQRMKAKLRVAQNMLDAHRYSNAAELAQAAVQIIPSSREAKELLDRAQALHEELEAHKRHAQQLIEDSNYEQARVELRKALKLRPQDKGVQRALITIPRKIRERDVRLAVERGNRLAQEERFEQALQAYDSALAIDSESQDLIELVDGAKKRLSEARAHFIEQSAAAAAECIQAQDFEQALQLTQRVLELQPDHEQAKEMLEVASRGDRERREQEAEQLLAEAAEFEEQKRYGIALARAEKALELLPERRDVEQKTIALRQRQALRNMVFIEAGDFIYGDTKHGLLRRPTKVRLPAFYIDRYPVTNAEYKEFCEATNHPVPNAWPEKRIPAGKEDHPVTDVTFLDAKAYAKWAGKRMPTEEEWEKAARGVDGRKFPWGDDEDDSRFNRGAQGATPVNKYPRGQSPYGVMDMIGNVWEWCDVRYNLDERLRVRRGGVGNRVGCTVRSQVNVNQSYTDLGFRCAKDADGPPDA